MRPRSARVSTARLETTAEVAPQVNWHVPVDTSAQPGQRTQHNILVQPAPSEPLIQQPSPLTAFNARPGFTVPRARLTSMTAPKEPTAAQDQCLSPVLSALMDSIVLLAHAQLAHLANTALQVASTLLTAHLAERVQQRASGVECNALSVQAARLALFLV